VTPTRVPGQVRKGFGDVYRFSAHCRASAVCRSLVDGVPPTEALTITHISQAPCRYLLLLCYSTWRYQLDRRLPAGSDTRPDLPLWTESEPKDALGRTSCPFLGRNARWSAGNSS
jgi:hypothetical protein